MNPGILKIFFRMAIFITLTSIFLVIFVPRGTAEFVVSVLSLIIGLVFIVLIVIVNAFSKK